MEDLISTPANLTPNYTFRFPFEDSFRFEVKRDWMIEYWHTSFYWIAAYMILVFGGQMYMSNREPFKLRRALTIWNVLLATFSIIGTFRTLPEMIHVLTNFGFHHSVCNPSYIEVNKVSAFWTWMFALSKVPELGDTIFIVLRKQNLIFLHWYHHITVLLYTWYSYKETISPARWYINMNYLVHSLMYSYYAARAIGIRIPKKIAMFITFSQLLQMVIGGIITYYGYLQVSQGEYCRISTKTAKFGIAMYASYFVLFAHFFINSYFAPKKPRTKKE